MGLIEAIRSAFDRRFPDWRDRSFVVAVSGGADSVALLRGALDLGVSFTVGHLNHRLRGDESEGDEAFVRELAGQLKVPFHSKRVEIASMAGNVESNARNVRYEWLSDLAKRTRASAILTGHTADDQAETVLHRLLRGTGLDGLSGIPEVRDDSEIAIFRPMLAVTRAEVLEYLGSKGQAFRTDSSNAELRFTRNRIRHELLPLLKTFNPDVVAVLNRLAEQAKEWTNDASGQIETDLRSVELPRAGERIVLNTALCRNLAEPRLRELLRSLWQREAWPERDMTREHWLRAAEAIRTGVAEAQFPGGVRIRCVARVVQLFRS